MGRGDAKNAARFGRVVALCDVDATNLARAKEEHPDAMAYSDFREVMARDDIHVVICATVDHWHTLVSLAAMKSGKDVYCEKPLTLTIEEGQRLVNAVKETGRILQTGSQQRSDRRFRLACELVRNSRIGRLQHIDVWIPAGLREGPFASSTPPQGLNWDFWQGQTMAVPYVKERCHVTFRYWWDYSGGTQTDWGAHHNDIALWALGLEPSGPKSIEGRALRDMIPGGYTAASEYEVHFIYPNEVTQTTRSTTDDNPFGGVTRPEGQRHGVKFTGSNGWIWVTRGNITASDAELIETPLPPDSVRLDVSDDHMGNFFDCVRTRRQPICSAEVGHRSASLCHIGVIAVRLGRKLQWDPAEERFVNDAEANEFLAREQRKPWTYEMV
jgi:predicted dehydrogenase